MLRPIEIDVTWNQSEAKAIDAKSKIDGRNLCRATSELLKREAAAEREPLPRWELPAHCH